MSAETFFAEFTSWVQTLGWPLAAGAVLLVWSQARRLDRNVRLHALMMGLYFFLIIATFWMLKPVKKTLLLTHYADGATWAGWSLAPAQIELVAKELNMVIALLAAITFSLLARWLRRATFAATVTGIFLATYAVFACVADNSSTLTVWTFYLGGDLFVTAMVAAFFAFLNDSEDPFAARRLYGLIGLGGVLGGAVGSTFISTHVRLLDAASVSGLVCASALAIMLLIAGAGRIVARHPPPEPRQSISDDAPGVQAAFAGASLTLHSRFLLMIAAIVVIYEMASTLVDYQFTATVLHYVAPSDLGAHFSNVFAFTNLAAVAVQLMLTPWILRRYGVGTGLMLLPAALGLCAAGFWIAPVLLFGSLLNTADNAFAYSLNQSAKEILYVPLSRDEKYRAKAFIDIFLLRSAKALAVALGLALSVIFAGFDNIRWLSLLVLALLTLWVLAVRWLGREYRVLERQTEPDPSKLAHSTG
ncbi:MAG: hypothetical protein H2060_07685 [Azoarcus sp.]|nr:hypothetical protein [Azoarcus sp.]